MSKPVAVIISDIHFTPATLELATAALQQAMNKAKELSVPLVLAGDTLDTKAIVRAECANRLIEMFDDFPTLIYVLVGNHDLLNEKGKEHSLNFLKPYANVIDQPFQVLLSGYPVYFIPYQSSKEAMQVTLDKTVKGSTLIIHQGVMGADMGHYVQDKTSLPPEAYGNFRVISGHYHKAQDIKCGRARKGAVGLFSYIGNPYTLTFGEANDGPKGFQVLHDDGSLKQVPTHLRKHLIFDLTLPTCALPYPLEGARPEDLVWVKLRGSEGVLKNIRKADVAFTLRRTDFKLDLYPDSRDELAQDKAKSQNVSDAEVFDSLIDTTTETPVKKQQLKALWREVIS